jgi:hypothetical protein
LSFSSIGNHIGTVGAYVVSNGNNSNFSAGDHFQNDIIRSGIYLGNLQIAATQEYTLTTTPLALGFASNSVFALYYEIRKQSNVRLGSFTVTNSGTDTNYNDEYTETENAVGANISANSDSVLASVSSGTATFKFNFKRFI